MSINIKKDSENYFDLNYKNYVRQNPPYKIAHYLKIVRRYHNGSGNLLDIGCGYGLFLEQAQAFYHIFGIEIYDDARKIAQKRVRNRPLRRDALPTIGFDERMHVITLFDVIEHVDDLPKSFEVLNQQLATSGIVVIVVPVYDGPLGFLVRFLDRDPTHIHKKSRHFWLSQISSYFEIVYWCGFFRYFFLNRFYLHFSTNMFRWLSPAILIVARKNSNERTAQDDLRCPSSIQ